MSTKKLLKELTPEQLSRTSYYMEEGLAIGLDTKPLVLADVTAAINEAYATVGLPPPKEVVILPSPLALARKGKEILKNKFSIYTSFGYGQQDINWLMFYKFFRDECNIEGIDKIEGLLKVAKACGWFLPFDTICYVSEKPVEIHIANKVLHNSKGPSVRYSDGFELYTLNGIPMEKRYVMEEVDVKTVMKEQNVDVRRELLRKIGLEKFIKDTGGKLIDELVLDLEYPYFQDALRKILGKAKGKRCVYQLLEINLGTESEPIKARVLKMDNPSIDAMHVEGVDDTCTTVKEALAWRNGFDTYVEPMRLT